MIAAIRDCITLVCAGLAGMTVAAGVIGLVVDWRKLTAELERDRRSGYQLPTEAKPKSRPCPPWIGRAEKGRATR